MTFFFIAVKSAPHQCNVCKLTVENSRAVTKASAVLLGLSDSDLSSDARVCNPCFMRAQRKKSNNNCPVPACTSTKGRVKGRLRHMPNKLKDLPKDARDAINNEFREWSLCLSLVSVSSSFFFLNRYFGQYQEMLFGLFHSTEPKNCSINRWLLYGHQTRGRDDQFCVLVRGRDRSHENLPQELGQKLGCDISKVERS